MFEQTIGNYKIGRNQQLGRTLGEGTFGKVKLAIHIPTDQKVAIKILEKDRIVEKSDIERVSRQISILKSLRHPNIVQLYQIMQTKKQLYLIMQYADGGQLFDYIVKQKRLSQRQAASFLNQILNGIDYIHKIGVVHRDLKPQNLLLDSNGFLKIVDFGLSNNYKPGELLKTPCGSPCYAAPQMIAGKRYQCLNVDIWSAGVIMYAMICGYLPFQDPNTSKLYKKIIAGDYQVPLFVSQQARKLFTHILDTNPHSRYKIDQIRKNKWISSYIAGNQYQSGIVVGIDQMKIDYQVLAKLEKFNFNIKQAEDLIQRNRHNQVTMTYYLLLKRVNNERKRMQKMQKPIQNGQYLFKKYAPIKVKKSDQRQRQGNESINASYTNKTKNTKVIFNNQTQAFEKNKKFPKDIKKTGHKKIFNNLVSDQIDNNNKEIQAVNNKNYLQAFLRKQQIKHKRTISNCEDPINFRNQKNRERKTQISYNIITEKQDQQFNLNKTIDSNFNYKANEAPQETFTCDKTIPLQPLSTTNAPRPSFQSWVKNQQSKKQQVSYKRESFEPTVSSGVAKSNLTQRNNIFDFRKSEVANIKQPFTTVRNKLIDYAIVPYYGPFNAQCVFKQQLQRLMQKMQIYFVMQKISYQWVISNNKVLSKFIMQINYNRVKGQIIINSLQNIKGIYLIRFKFQKHQSINRLIQDFLRSLS